jgi:hypothetical protein
MGPGKSSEKMIGRKILFQFSGLYVFIGKIYDLSEYDRVEQRETDIQTGQEQGKCRKPFIRFQIS